MPVKKRKCRVHSSVYGSSEELKYIKDVADKEGDSFSEFCLMAAIKQACKIDPVGGRALPRAKRFLREEATS